MAKVSTIVAFLFAFLGVASCGRIHWEAALVPNSAVPPEVVPVPNAVVPPEAALVPNSDATLDAALAPEAALVPNADEAIAFPLCSQGTNCAKSTAPPPCPNCENY